jgi:hypothetical protein
MLWSDMKARAFSRRLELARKSFTSAVTTTLFQRKAEISFNTSYQAHPSCHFTPAASSVRGGVH